MNIVLFGKEGCGKCDAAKDKLEKYLKVNYSYIDIEEVMANPTADWRVNGVVDAVARYFQADIPDLPMISIDGIVHTYGEAMKELKRLKV